MADEPTLHETQNLDLTVTGIQGNPVSPAVPVVGDALVWDGTVWAPTPVGGGGPVLGITDGSNAAPGYVGEQLNADATNNAIPQGTPTTLVSLNLTPGDWLVSAGISWAGNAPGGYGVSAWLSNSNGGGSIGAPYTIGTELQTTAVLVNFAGNTGLLRFNTTTARTLYWVVYTLGSPAYSEGWINAYRWR